jgi:hypothetical protein
MQKNRMWFGTIVRLQSIALLDELMVKLEICYRVWWGDYFHNGYSSYIKFAYIYNVVVLIINHNEHATNIILCVYVSILFFWDMPFTSDSCVGFLVGVVGVGCHFLFLPLKINPGVAMNGGLIYKNN